jgi:hypothetical protein
MDLRYKVFTDAEIGGSAVFIFAKEKNKKDAMLLTVNTEETFATPQLVEVATKDLLDDKDHNFVQSKGAKKITQKIVEQKNVVELGAIAKIYQGIITGDNGKYLSEKATTSKWKPILKGRNINRYSTSFNNVYVYYSPNDLWSNTDEKMFKVPAKIISRQTSDRLIATLDTEQYFSLDSTHVIHVLSNEIDIKYILGLYNSRLINFLYQSRVQEGGRVFAQVKTVNLKPLPIKLVDQNNKSEVKIQHEIIHHVDVLLKLNIELKDAKLQTNVNQLKQRIEHSEDKINQLVYELYELSEADIKIIEEQQAPNK